MNKSPNKALTIIIPTRNRPKFLERLLTYYALEKLEYLLIVADSSNADFLDQDKKICARFKNQLQIVLHAFSPDIPFVEKIVTVLSSIRTPYTVIVADDDFTIPAAMAESVDFLHTHRDYSVAHGSSYNFGVKSENSHSQIDKLEPYSQREILEATAIERLINHLSDYSTTFYSIHRTEQIRQNFNVMASLSLDANFSELLPSCLSIIQGKIKKLDCLYMLRQGWIPKSEKSYTAPDFFDWVVDENWSVQYSQFIHILASALTEVEEIAENDTAERVKQAMSVYLTYYLLFGVPNQELMDKQKSAEKPLKRKLIHVIERLLIPQADVFYDDLVPSTCPLTSRLFAFIQIRRLCFPSRRRASNLLDWMADPRWARLYKTFHDQQVRAILHRSPDEGLKVHINMKYVFWVYLAACLSRQTPVSVNPGNHTPSPQITRADLPGLFPDDIQHLRNIFSVIEDDNALRK